jgi:hypothetical protein
MRPMSVIRLLVLPATFVLTLTGCTSHGTARLTAQEICHRHFPVTTLAINMHAADVRFVGGPRPLRGVASPFDSAPDRARVVRCLVPSSADSAAVQDVLVSSDKTFLRWTQGGSTDSVRHFQPPL